MDEIDRLNRRAFVEIASLAVAGYSIIGMGAAKAGTRRTLTLFNGKTLDGWIQIENSATSLNASQINDKTAFVSKLLHGEDAVSVFLRTKLDDEVKTNLADDSENSADAKAVLSALMKNLNQIIAGPALDDSARFRSVVLRPETKKLLKRNPSGYDLARLNKMLIEDAYAAELNPAPFTGWGVKDGAMASTGSGRGVIYTVKDFSRYRLIFTMRHVSGKPDHQACVLIFCQRPRKGEVPLDALGGIQFQVPNGGHWDYRQGKNTGGGAEFTTITKTHLDVHEWSRVEILADATSGTARMAVAQPVGSKAVQVLDFKDPSAGKIGPIAWQMHNAGLFDEYKDVAVELDPKDNELVTTR